MKTYLIIFALTWVCFQKTQSQDTVFLKSFTFDEPVANIDGAGEFILVRTTNNIYRLNENNEFHKIRSLDPNNSGNYTWLGKRNRNGNYDTYNTEFIPKNKIIGYYPVGGFLPGYHHANITMAMDGNNMYVTFRGNILLYTLNNFYDVKNRWESVRDVYIDDSLKITSTYSAIYRDKAYNYFGFDTIRGINYSNGEVNKIEGRYYLCADELYVLKDSGWLKSPIQSGLKPEFRKLSRNKSTNYFLSLKAFDTILFNPNGEFYDIEWLNKRAYLSNKDGELYIYEENQPIKKINLKSAIYDINITPDKKDAILSCRDGIYKLNLESLKTSLLLSLHDSFESIFVDGELLISTSHGLYIMFEGEAKVVIPRIEFNKYALSLYDNLVFAGSIEGLYVIDKDVLLKDILKSLKNTQYYDNRQFIMRLGTILLIIMLATIFFLLARLYFRKTRTEKLILKKSSITPDQIRQIVIENQELISVESIAEFFETSTVQLNRILKKYNTSGLMLLKSIKQDIVKDLIKQGKPIEEIAQRVGYSVNYTKRNLL